VWEGGGVPAQAAVGERLQSGPDDAGVAETLGRSFEFGRGAGGHEHRESDGQVRGDLDDVVEFAAGAAPDGGPGRDDGVDPRDAEAGQSRHRRQQLLGAG
jgi:hypothetical protein